MKLKWRHLEVERYKKVWTEILGFHERSFQFHFHKEYIFYMTLKKSRLLDSVHKRGDLSTNYKTK